ncbi:hypothetical protein LNKW23_08810 [Paralimibaculum aggregatum]|uniref:Tetratricopeptide repeat protein n=1 Tax=Paralimibaculum aggregatum TaxID=3036245 RepID=A0ABQ6LLG9_9RHOB|nr:hypothetical protein [Limibaculum sp. NKW23]GMG81668.1 hypothetical protein LNKW23_08810 [Limibaculum sp. NKW23]
MSSIEARLKEAEDLRESDTMEAEARLAALLAEAPENPKIYNALHQTQLRRGDAGAALATAEAALRRWPERADFRLSRSFARFVAGDMAGVRDDLAAVRRIARSQEGDLLLGLAHHALGEHGAAVEVLQGALALGAGGEPGVQARAWVALMRLYRDLGYEPAADDAANAARRLYDQRPVWVSSTISKLINRRDCPGWERVRRKDGLAGALARMDPAARPRTPESYVLPAERERLMGDAAAGRSGPVWIVKSGDLFGGQGISLTDDPASIPADFDGVVQQYVDRPHLFEGRKGHLRTYVLITSASPLRAWFWRDGLVRFAPAPYARGEGWLARRDMHITNTAAHTGHKGLFFHRDPKVEDRGSIWGLRAFIERISPDPEPLWQRLEETARRAVALIAADGLVDEMAAGGRAYLPKLIGIDMLLDETLEPWLIELQRVPGQTGPGPVNTVNARLFREVFEMTVAPIIGGEGDMAAREAAAERAAAQAFRPL